MSRRAILQIGTEKTGTTSLQSFLSTNRDRLRQRGFIYPRFCGEINQIGLAAYAMSAERLDPLRQAYGIQAPQDVEPMRRRMREAADAEIEGTQTAIFCNEHCHSRLTKPEEVATLREFLARHFDDVQVTIYLRRQDQVAVSLYSTRLKSGATDQRILPATNSNDPYFNYDRSLALWESCFGRGNITVRLFDRNELAGGSVVTDFLQTWGIGDPADFRTTPNQNESVSPEAQDFLRRVNAHLTPIEGLPLADLLGPLSANLARLFPGSGAKPDRKAAQAFYDAYRSSNEAVRARYFPDRTTLFSEDFSGYPEGAHPYIATYDGLALIAARLLTEASREIRRLESEIAIRDARLAWERGDQERAISTLFRARAWLPTHAPAHRVLGEYLLQVGRVDEAQQAAGRAAELSPGTFEYWHFLGVVERRQGNLLAAEGSQLRALELNPEHSASRACLEQIRQALTGAQPVVRSA
jgi:hypothetical protein